MKRVGKPVFFLILLLIVCFGCLVICGVSTRYGDISTTYVRGVRDIRWGIDIRGGVDVTFMPAAGRDADEVDMQKIEDILRNRLVSLGITDSEVYTDMQKDRVIVRFPWKADETTFDPELAIAELGQTSHLTFRLGTERDDENRPAGITADTVLLEGRHVSGARVGTSSGDARRYNVVLSFSEAGARLFAEATHRHVDEVVSIWMDDEMISQVEVREAITGGEVYIEGIISYDRAATLARQINSGALPFKLETENYSVISPSLGMEARDAMILAGAIAFLFVALFMVFFYRLSGVVAVIALVGQLFIMAASLTIPSFTLTLPGIAGIILSMGFGVDANIITASRIREEIYAGKAVQTAIDQGYKRAFRAVLDSNMTVFIVACVLMGGFGTPDNLLVRLFSPLFFMFGSSTAGAIYSFGYMLFAGVVANVLMGVLASQYMIKSLSAFVFFQRDSLYFRRSGHRAFGLHIVENHKGFFMVFTVIMLVALIWAAVGGISMGIQFRGGTLITYGFDGKLAKDSFRDRIEWILMENVTLREMSDATSGNRYFVVSLAAGRSMSSEDQSRLTEQLQSVFPDNDVHVESISAVNPAIGREFLRKSAFVTMLAAALLLAFIGWRFRHIGGISAGVSAVIAVVHDLFIILTVFVFFGIAIDDNFIAVVLFILGYSLNDTIVIFDRIRENKNLLRSRPMREVVNRSINQSLSRSIATTITTVATMAVVTVVALIYNVESIISFSFPMMIGMISGVYSSLCIAGTLWVLWQERGQAKKSR